MKRILITILLLTTPVFAQDKKKQATNLTYLTGTLTPPTSGFVTLDQNRIILQPSRYVILFSLKADEVIDISSASDCTKPNLVKAAKLVGILVSRNAYNSLDAILDTEFKQALWTRDVLKACEAEK